MFISNPVQDSPSCSFEKVKDSGETLITEPQADETRMSGSQVKETGTSESQDTSETGTSESQDTSETGTSESQDTSETEIQEKPVTFGIGDFECIDSSKFRLYTSNTGDFVENVWYANFTNPYMYSPANLCVTRNPPKKNPCIGKEKALLIDKKV